MLITKSIDATIGNIDNALVTQKNYILARLNAANTSTASLNAVCDMLDLVLPVWNAAAYAYKGQEICNRIDQLTTDIDLQHRARRLCLRFNNTR